MPKIPFSLTAAQVDTLETTAVTFATLATNARLARVPRLLIAHLPAGDAYTVSAGARIEIRDDDNNVLFSIPAKGFLDQATAQSRVVLPSTGAFTASSATFTAELRGTVSKGSASSALAFEFYFEEIPLTLS